MGPLFRLSHVLVQVILWGQRIFQDRQKSQVGFFCNDCWAFTVTEEKFKELEQDWFRIYLFSLKSLQVQGMALCFVSWQEHVFNIIQPSLCVLIVWIVLHNVSDMRAVNMDCSSWPWPHLSPTIHFIPADDSLLPENEVPGSFAFPQCFYDLFQMPEHLYSHVTLFCPSCLCGVL